MTHEDKQTKHEKRKKLKMKTFFAGSLICDWWLYEAMKT